MKGQFYAHVLQRIALLIKSCAINHISNKSLHLTFFYLLRFANIKYNLSFNHTHNIPLTNIHQYSITIRLQNMTLLAIYFFLLKPFENISHRCMNVTNKMVFGFLDNLLFLILIRKSD